MTIYDWFKPQIEAQREAHPNAEDFKLYYLSYHKKKLTMMSTTFMDLHDLRVKFTKMESNLPRTH